MADTTKLAQTSITQFFPRVDETDVINQRFPHPLETPTGDVPNQRQNILTEDAQDATAVDENLPT